MIDWTPEVLHAFVCGDGCASVDEASSTLAQPSPQTKACSTSGVQSIMFFARHQQTLALIPKIMR
jgi:hypothetical protein